MEIWYQNKVNFLRIFIDTEDFIRNLRILFSTDQGNKSKRCMITKRLKLWSILLDSVAELIISVADKTAVSLFYFSENCLPGIICLFGVFRSSNNVQLILRLNLILISWTLLFYESNWKMKLWRKLPVELNIFLSTIIFFSTSNSLYSRITNKSTFISLSQKNRSARKFNFILLKVLEQCRYSVRVLDKFTSLLKNIDSNQNFGN